jgi:hypothetical protein
LFRITGGTRQCKHQEQTNLVVKVWTVNSRCDNFSQCLHSGYQPEVRIVQQRIHQAKWAPAQLLLGLLCASSEEDPL